MGKMIDPRREIVFIRPSKGEDFVDRTSEVRSVTRRGSRVEVTFSSERGDKFFAFSPARISHLTKDSSVSVGSTARVEINGVIHSNVSEIVHFHDGASTYVRVFSTIGRGETHRVHKDPRIRVVDDVAESPGAASILRYWKAIVARLPDDDPLHNLYKALPFVHPESGLAGYLNAAPIVTAAATSEVIFPFDSNLSQRQAVENALRSPVSVIDGPPGTGKTQTILNLIANIILDPAKTVAVVSFNNAAVDNVRDKLDQAGFGHIVAGLGNRQKCAAFFAGQAERNAKVAASAGVEGSPRVDGRHFAELDAILQKLRLVERQRAELKQELAAYRLEMKHFATFASRQELPDLTRVPLLRRSSKRILDYLVDIERDVVEDGQVIRLVRRVRRYFLFGPVGGVDASDTRAVLGVQRGYYEKKCAELEEQIRRADDDLDGADFKALADSYRKLSLQTLSAALDERYAGSPVREYQESSYKKEFAAFARDFPVILSTCHSLRRNLPEGQLLDYLIIDEASQVNLLAAGLALSCARNIIVVGDLQQLQHIVDAEACQGVVTPANDAYDYQKHNVLSSMIELHGSDLPRTMLREHYRSDPEIIGFCNAKFYGGQLVPFTVSSPGSKPLLMLRTTEGNHMRKHVGGGFSNQREVDVIVQEIIPQYLADIAPEQIGIATPYRRQVDKVAGAVVADIESDTVHKFQGREKDVVIMSAVLDETWQGHHGASFVDDPHLVNVAVSRAKNKFVLVANYDLLPKSRNLRDLIGYIRYHDPEFAVVDSGVISVFDLLYRDYSRRLQPLALRVKQVTKFKSENIIAALLQTLLTEPRYHDFEIGNQVLLQHLVKDQEHLSPQQEAYIRHRASIDFVVYNRVTKTLLFAIEVDGFAFHENKPDQRRRDLLKDAICADQGIRLLRLATTGSNEEDQLRRWLDEAAVA
jgi:hypothetical protein